jgi:hypothetical protein
MPWATRPRPSLRSSPSSVETSRTADGSQRSLSARVIAISLKGRCRGTHPASPCPFVRAIGGSVRSRQVRVVPCVVGVEVTWHFHLVDAGDDAHEGDRQSAWHQRRLVVGHRGLLVAALASMMPAAARSTTTRRRASVRSRTNVTTVAMPPSWLSSSSATLSNTSCRKIGSSVSGTHSGSGNSGRPPMPMHSGEAPK